MKKIVGALALGLFCTGGALAQTPDWDTVVAKAKQEGQLVVYTALVGDPTLKAIVAQFQKNTGIRVSVLEGRATEIRERTRTEMAAGRFLADVTFTSSGQAALIAREDKSYVPHGALPNASKLRAPFKDDGLFAPVMTIAYGMLVNANTVTPDNEPKSWADLADPKWKGKILSDDMRAVGGGYLMFFATLQDPTLGEKYHVDLAKNNIVFDRSMRESPRRIARGEFSIYIPFIYTDMANLKGLPVRWIMPKEGSPYVLYGNALNRDAPHPNAALLYMDYWMSDEAQLMWAKTGMGVTRDGLGDRIPAEVRPLTDAKLLGTTDPDKQNEGLALAKRIYQ